jgi:hypothetical protein
MATQPETRLVKAIREAILAAYPDSVFWKIHGSPYQESGIPDLVGCIHGRFVGLEVKKQEPGESTEHAYARTTELQLYQRDRILRAGGACATVLSVPEALAVIAAALS